MKIIWSSTNPGIQAPIWIASDSCRDLSVLLPFNSSWISDRAPHLVCARIKCLGSSTDLLHPQCAYSTWSSLTFLWSSLWAKQATPKAPFHLGCLSCSQFMGLMPWNAAIRRTGLSLFSLCRAQVWCVTQMKPLAAGVPIARLRQLCAVKGTRSTQQALTAPAVSHLQSTKPLHVLTVTAPCCSSF